MFTPKNNVPGGLQALVQNMRQNFLQRYDARRPTGPRQMPVQQGVMGGQQGFAGAPQNLPMQSNPGQDFMQSLGMYGNQGPQPQGVMPQPQGVMPQGPYGQGMMSQGPYGPQSNPGQDFMQSLGMYGNQGPQPQGVMPQGPYGQGMMGAPQGLGGVGAPPPGFTPNFAGSSMPQGPYGQGMMGGLGGAITPYNSTTTQDMMGGARQNKTNAVSSMNSLLGGEAGQKNMGAFANTYNQPKLI